MTVFGLARKRKLEVNVDEEEYLSGCCVKRKSTDGMPSPGFAGIQELRENRIFDIRRSTQVAEGDGLLNR